MATRKTNRTSDLHEHKRKIFFENLSPTTRTNSLREYLSGFEMERCVVPDKDGKNQGYGLAVFCKESSVNTLMAQRPHRIDNQHVDLYRSVPGQGSLKENKGIKNLIVSGIKKGPITKSDLEQYFCGFGTIVRIDMYYDENSCCIEFEDYDAVDKALLDAPHTIKKVEVNLNKGNRNSRAENITSSKNIQTAYNNNTSAMPKKSIMKQVQIDHQVSSVNIPKTIYCIHIKNLRSNVNAEILSKQFNWPIDNILINSPLDNQSLPIECWLKDIDELQEAECFVQRWNEQTVLGEQIECEVEEDKLDLCKEFRIGQCLKTNDVCDWSHIMCTANGKCSNDCLYGHEKGMKTGYINDCSNETYRLKITGFQRTLTPGFLARILPYSSEEKCYVNPHQDHIGYILQLRTMKYAKRLMAKWHNKVIDGQKLQCQIELNARSSMSYKTLSRTRSMSNIAVRENDFHRPSRNWQQPNNSAKTSRNSSVSRENSDSNITTLDDRELNNEGRLFAQSRDVIVKQRDSDTMHKAKSVDNLDPFVDSQCQTLNTFSKCETSKHGRKMSEIQKKTVYGSSAFLVKYDNIDKETYYREFTALKLLKGVKGVVQLIEPEDPSNNNDQRLSSKNDLSLITERPLGYSLKEYVNQIHRGGFGVLEAIQLVKNLITIIKQIHSQGVLHQNLGPDNIMIDQDTKQTSIDQAQLTLIDFSQAYIKSEKNNQIIKSIAGCWYKPPQANVESLKYSSTIDASNNCAILLWLLTNIDPRHDQDLFPHQQENVIDRLDNKIAQAVRNANLNRKQLLEETQLKTYLIDTFDIGFGYPQHQPWTISDLECRLESIHELLSPKNPKLNTTDAIFRDLISTYNNAVLQTSSKTNVHNDIFQKASIAFQHAKTSFSESNPNQQYSWSDGGCTWVDSTQISMNERRHDDILTYYFRDGRMSSNCSIIITCLATLTDEGNRITLSIGSAVNGKTSRIPIGRYSKTQNYMAEFKRSFITALDNLIISICKERRAIQE